MRQMLMTMLLILTVVVLYLNAVDGDEGTGEHIRNSGSSMAGAISRISP
ncbi:MULTISPECIES: hypothetical protein [Cohnella]|nr:MULTISPECIES: hypothetical protein [Cohnella]MBN2982630.1 hypothetical protein [Cohnella algarum]